VEFVSATYGRLHFLSPDCAFTVDRIEAGIIATGARLVVIDYFQLLRGQDAGANRTDDLDDQMDKLKRMAIRQQCAVVVVCEVAKSVSADSRAGQIGRHSAAIDYGCYNLFYGDFTDGKPPPADHEGPYGITWHCKKLKGRKKKNLRLVFDGEHQTFYEASARPHDEFNQWASFDNAGVP
jgi:hypothetical protein